MASLLVTTATSSAAQHRWGLLPTFGLDGAAVETELDFEDGKTAAIFRQPSILRRQTP